MTTAQRIMHLPRFCPFSSKAMATLGTRKGGREERERKGGAVLEGLLCTFDVEGQHARLGLHHHILFFHAAVPPGCSTVVVAPSLRGMDEIPGATAEVQVDGHPHVVWHVVLWHAPVTEHAEHAPQTHHRGEWLDCGWLPAKEEGETEKRGIGERGGRVRTELKGERRVTKNKTLQKDLSTAVSICRPCAQAPRVCAQRPEYG